MVDYVKEDIEPNFEQIPRGYAQKFAHKFSLNSVAAVPIIQLRNEGRQRDGKGLSDQDQEIAEFLFRNTFATAKQLFDYFEVKTDLAQGIFLKRLNYLVASHILNAFTLHAFDNAKGEFNDALRVYCLDFGGKYLINNFSKGQFYQSITNWYSTDNMRSSQFIAKDLIQTQFFIRLMATLKKNKAPEDLLCNYLINPEYRNPATSEKFTVSAQMELKDQVLKSNVNGAIIDIVYPEEEGSSFRMRMKNTDGVLARGAWHKYFDLSDKTPMYIIVLTNIREQLGFISKTLDNSTSLDLTNVRFISVNDLKDGYLDDEDKFKEIKFQADLKNPDAPKKLMVKGTSLDWFGK